MIKFSFQDILFPKNSIKTNQVPTHFSYFSVNSLIPIISCDYFLNTRAKISTALLILEVNFYIKKNMLYFEKFFLTLRNFFSKISRKSMTIQKKFFGKLKNFFSSKKKFSFSGLGSSGHDFDNFPTLCEGIFSGQLGLFRGCKEFSFRIKMTLR